MYIDIDSLRDDLTDYVGTAMSYNPAAQADLIKISNATNEEIVNEAIKNGFNIYDYEVNDYPKTR